MPPSRGLSLVNAGLQIKNAIAAVGYQAKLTSPAGSVRSDSWGPSKPPLNDTIIQFRAGRHIPPALFAHVHSATISFGGFSFVKTWVITAPILLSIILAGR